ncbi:hypothetical protein CAPTEDRAFT_216778 [Capitella teleta]|uniref:Uncharacterized protein n=1 Tax=Capitella teleta TaxID=283909 RepID=R7V874_CAPTE|nr:hypothetical protein CAPTEDRAFT_216778 [Capitella teleta]|eukprot:ELU11970.1 hypothetical protein CAPTEDRAFT_216778 [Capitella teleta]
MPSVIETLWVEGRRPLPPPFKTHQPPAHSPAVSGLYRAVTTPAPSLQSDVKLSLSPYKINDIDNSQLDDIDILTLGSIQLQEVGFEVQGKKFHRSADTRRPIRRSTQRKPKVFSAEVRPKVQIQQLHNWSPGTNISTARSLSCFDRGRTSSWEDRILKLPSLTYGSPDVMSRGYYNNTPVTQDSLSGDGMDSGRSLALEEKEYSFLLRYKKQYDKANEKYSDIEYPTNSSLDNCLNINAMGRPSEGQHKKLSCNSLNKSHEFRSVDSYLNFNRSENESPITIQTPLYLSMNSARSMDDDDDQEKRHASSKTSRLNDYLHITPASRQGLIKNMLR